MAKGDRGKFNKRGGPGARSGFQATSAEEIELRNQRMAEFDEQRAARRAADSDEEEEVETEELGIENGMDNVSLSGKADGEKPLTRKQIEQADKERKAAEYRRRHELGLTDEYKRDMAKLAEVRKRREEAEKRAKAEKDLQEAMEEERKQKVAAIGQNDSSDSEDDSKKKKKSSKKSVSIPKLDKIVIKKMKPTQLKDALKARGLDIQGNAKELTSRLLEYEANR
jgi:hypothetical protein